MKRKKPYEPPKIIDLQVDYTQAVGVSRCTAGNNASNRCNNGSSADQQCNTGQRAAGHSCLGGPAGK